MQKALNAGTMLNARCQLGEKGAAAKLARGILPAESTAVINSTPASSGAGDPRERDAASAANRFPAIHSPEIYQKGAPRKSKIFWGKDPGSAEPLLRQGQLAIY